MTRVSTSTLYGSLNARQLTYAEIADSFVAPAEFTELCRSNNHVLLGPRGSGKTMLMKMLTPAALYRWKQRNDAQFIEPAFIGVYVPTDLLWARSLNQYWATSPPDGQGGLLARRLIQYVITLNILEAFLMTVETLHAEVDIQNAEADLVEDLSERWEVPVRALSFYRLQQVLAQRVSMASAWLEQTIVDPRGPQIADDEREWLFADPIRLVASAIDAACHHLRIPRDKRWALCFDELEIAPGWLREYVVSALRSTDQRLLFKLSASPMQALATEDLFPNTSQQLHDYTIVKLWHTGVIEARGFCERLAQHFVARHLGPAATPGDIFGKSNFATTDDESDSTYQPGSDFWRRVRELSKYDPGLRRLLREKQISLEHLGHIDQKTRDEVLRKLKPIVMLRHAFLKPNPRRPDQPAGRSRKVTSIYTGAEAIYAACDGNPRWLTGLLTDMLPSFRGKVSRSAQAAVIAEAADRFLALLSVMPESTQVVHNKTLSLRAVLETVGQYFERTMLGAELSLDPKGTFIVDSAAGDELVELIRMAATQGAIIYLDPTNIDLNSSPRGKRFRLSFLLAPKFRLPFRVYDHLPLSRCLGGTIKSRLADEVFEFEQAELFSA